MARCIWERDDYGQLVRVFRDVPSSYHDVGYRCVVCGVTQCCGCVGAGDEEECLGRAPTGEVDHG